MKSVGWCGKLSFIIGLGYLLFGIYILYKELAASVFVIHQSIATAFICLGIFFLFHFVWKLLERKTQASVCTIRKSE